MTTPKCAHCGNDGSEAGLYLTVDAKWRPDIGAWEFEEREDASGMDFDCLACDERTDAIGADACFAYGALMKPDGSIAGSPSLTESDWELIADAISNSDMPGDDRLRLLDKIQ